MKNKFLKNEQIQPWIWLRYTDDIFFIWTVSEIELDESLERLNNFHPYLKFTDKRSREGINFLDVTVRANHGEFVINLYCKPNDQLSVPNWAKSDTIFNQRLDGNQLYTGNNWTTFNTTDS